MHNYLILCLALLATQGALAAPEPAPIAVPSSGVILQYHHVDSETPPATSITPERFKAQMDYLADNGFTVWPLDKLVAHVRAGLKTPDRAVAITFDDAYLSIYTTAFPLLKQYGWPFTIFVATEMVGVNADQFLNWAQLNELQDNGAIIANHTHTHTHLIRQNKGESVRQWRKRVSTDIEKAAALIKANTGSESRLLAYPYGEYDDAVLDIVRDLGLTGFGQQSGALGPDGIFEALPRFPMGGIYSDLESFKTKVATLPLPIKTVRVDPLVTGEFRPVLTLEFLYEHPRLDLLTCYGPGGEPIALERTSQLRFVARSETPIPVGRSRYNCTMPNASGERFYWFSQMWIRANPDGSWYPEP